MPIIDTHSHVYAPELQVDIAEVIQRAIAANVEHILMPNIDSSSITHMLDMEQNYGNMCKPMMGLHPCYVLGETVKQELDLVKSWLQKRTFCAIGEIGLDLYWRQDNIQEQIMAFTTQLQWSLEMDLPVSIHCRSANEELIKTVKALNKPHFKGIWHCFSGTVDEAKTMIDLGFSLGIGGIVTYKKSELPLVLQQIGLNHLVLETDAPYLPPVPYRGKRNEPSYLTHVVQKLADIFETTAREVEEQTYNNAKTIFNL